MITGIIIAIVAVLLAAVLSKKISGDYAKDREYIRKHGGMRKLYSVFIDGILEYHSAVINNNDDYNSITITGDYTAVKDSSKHGTWELAVKHTFKIVQIDLTTKIYFNDVVQGAKHWEFPIGKEQHEMLREVKGKMNEANEQGLIL